MVYDVSYCQKGLDITKLPDADKIIIRMGIRDHEDSECRYFVHECQKHGIPFDYYWYVTSKDIPDAKKEGKHIADIYSNLRHRYNANGRVWLDVEDDKPLTGFKWTYPVFKAILTMGALAEIGVYSFISSFKDKRINPDMLKRENVPAWVAWWKSDVADNIKKAVPTAKLWQVGKTRIGKQEVDYNYEI